MIRLLNLVLVALLVLSGCERASANKQTLISYDCGVTWSVIEPGHTVPPIVVPCAYKVTIPDHPMQGDARFKTSFANNVLVDVEVGYDYSIVEPLKFVSEAKYLGRANSSVDDDVNSSPAYELAENSVIDVRLRDITNEIARQQDVSTYSPSELEAEILSQVNTKLEPLGVQLNFMSFVPVPDMLTREAIDAVTAKAVYDSKGLTELGMQVIVARAGACKLTLNANGAENK